MENKVVTVALVVASFISGIGGTIIVDSIMEYRAKARREEDFRNFINGVRDNVQQKR